MTVGEWLATAERELSAAGVDSARLESQLLAAHILRVDRTWLHAHPEAEFPEMAGHSFLERRLGREPLAYLLGRREFYGRSFEVGAGVLIPRQETETLVQAALDLDPHFERDLRCLDLGTGSGAIAVTLKLERPRWKVTASDVSSRALGYARRNAEILGADVRFTLSDLFENLAGEAFDLIVTNPPYIARGESLMPEVADFEPPEALFAEEHGLGFYRELSEHAQDHLLDQGHLLMEVGFSQSEEVARLFERNGWQHRHTIADLSGVPRVVSVGWVFPCRSV